MRLDELYQIDPETRALFRKRMDSDPWYFSKYVCNHADKAVERLHRPYLYAYTGQASLLAAALGNERFEGIITHLIREDFARQNPPIQWWNPEHLSRVKARLRRVNFRLPRGFGKSTFADDGDAWDGVIDPNVCIGIGSKSDDYAWKRIGTIGEIVMSPEFAFWYPERVPADPKSDVVRDSILLAGRTIRIIEETISGRGITSQWRGRHFNRRIRLDDTSGTEYGQASVEDSIRFNQGIDAIEVQEAFGTCEERYLGTISGEMDDHTWLASDPGVMSIVMPIEIHVGGTTIETLFGDGELTMPEEGWFTRDKVNTLKRKARANEDKYSVSELLQNFYMTAMKDSGSFVFTKAMLDAARGIFWAEVPELARECLFIPKKGKEKTQRDRTKPDFNPEDWKMIDVASLPRTARAWAADQSVSQTGDEWAFADVVMDWDGVEILLECTKGRGYDLMLDTVIPFDKRCGYPRRCGVDANATQGMTIDWMNRSPEFQSIARRIEPLTSGGEAKDNLIRRWIAGRMLTGDFYVNPRLVQWLHEASRYQPRDSEGKLRKNAIDNQLDATWMACSLCKRPPSPEQLDADKMAGLMSNARNMTADNRSGIDRSNWMDSVPGSERAA